MVYLINIISFKSSIKKKLQALHYELYENYKCSET